jgi:hypothetical protein
MTHDWKAVAYGEFWAENGRPVPVEVDGPRVTLECDDGSTVRCERRWTAEHNVLVSHGEEGWLVSVSRLDGSRVAGDEEAFRAIDQVKFHIPRERLELQWVGAARGYGEVRMEQPQA